MPAAKLLDQVRGVLRAKHFSLSTEKAYVAWIRRFILFHGKRHPKYMGEQEIRAFISHLAADARIQHRHRRSRLVRCYFFIAMC